MTTRSIVLTVLVALPIGCTNPSYEPASVENNGPDRETGPEARAIFETAVEALGGADRIVAVGALVMEGTGEMSNIGQNRTPEDENPVWEIIEFRRDVDLGGRMRTRDLREARFLFAGATTRREDRGVDGTRGFRVDDGQTIAPLPAGASGDLRREFLHHPLTLTRAALDAPTTFRLSGDGGAGARETIVLDLESGESFRLEVDPDTGLPRAIVSESAHPNLGDVAIRTEFGGWTDIDGLQLPHRLTRTVDRFVELELDVESYAVDTGIDIPSTESLAGVPMAPDSFAVTVRVERVADGIWWLHGSGNHRSILFEFEDHLTLFEVPSSEARSQAVITTARTLVPDKPLTEAIVSHHHFDHSAGLRVAVASGLRIIAHESNAAFFEELVSRPHARDPDALEQFPAPMEMVEVGDRLVLEDATMRVELYHVLDNPREGTNIFAWVPRDRILVQADLYDSGWLSHPWADNFRDNLERRGLSVALHVPVHGTIQTDEEVLETLRSRGIN